MTDSPGSRPECCDHCLDHASEYRKRVLSSDEEIHKRNGDDRVKDKTRTYCEHVQGEHCGNVRKIIEFEKVSTDETRDSERCEPHQSDDPPHDDCVQNDEEVDNDAGSLAELRDDDSEAGAKDDDAEDVHTLRHGDVSLYNDVTDGTVLRSDLRTNRHVSCLHSLKRRLDYVLWEHVSDEIQKSVQWRHVSFRGNIRDVRSFNGRISRMNDCDEEDSQLKNEKLGEQREEQNGPVWPELQWPDNTAL